MRLWFPVSSPLFRSSCWGEDLRYGLGKNPDCGLNHSPQFNMTRRRLAHPAPGLAQHGLLVLAAVCQPRRQVGGRRYENSWSVGDARLGVRALVGGCDDDVTMMKKEERLGSLEMELADCESSAQARFMHSSCMWCMFAVVDGTGECRASSGLNPGSCSAYVGPWVEHVPVGWGWGSQVGSEIDRGRCLIAHQAESPHHQGQSIWLDFSLISKRRQYQKT